MVISKITDYFTYYYCIIIKNVLQYSRKSKILDFVRCNVRNFNITTYHNPTWVYSPIANININIVDYGFQGRDRHHNCGPAISQKHVFQYIIGGKGSYKISDKKYALTTGDMFYIPKNCLVEYSSNPDDPYYYYWIGFDGISADEIISRTGFSDKAPVKHLSDPRIENICKNIFDAIDPDTYAGHITGIGEFYKLLGLLLSYEQQNTHKQQAVTIEYINKAILYIQHNFSKDISVSALANELGVCREHFSIMFKKQTGMTPIEYIVNYRINQAQMMLTQGITVSQTAEMCGFNSLAHFSYQFKRLVGMPPGSFKNK